MNNANAILDIPGYRILRRLGRGGMATVYLASQESLSRMVAIKVLAERLPDEDMVRRFENEARTIARLDHPHIVSIFDVGRTSDGQIYYTMPYLPNGDLAERSVRDDPVRILEIVRALAQALGSAHDLGIVHRDVKPENVLFDALDRPLLADFGIAFSSAGGVPRVTREGATVGSSGYMSPEQARGQAIDGRSDLYSLGVVCYELLTGEVPFRGNDALSVALAHIEKPIPQLPVTRRIWQPFIDRALAKQPDARFQSAEEMLAGLEVVGKRMRAPAKNGPARWWGDAMERLVAIPRRHRVLALCLGLILVLAGLLALLPRVPDRSATIVAPTIETHTANLIATPPPPEPAAVDAPIDNGNDSGNDNAEALTTEPDPHRRARRLADARTLMSDGRMVSPSDNNAAELYLAILADEPGQADAIAGLRRILESLANDAARSIKAADGGSAIAPITLGIGIVGRGKLVSGTAFAAFVAPIHRAIEERRTRASGPLGATALADLKPLLPTLVRIDSAQSRQLQAEFDKVAALMRGEGNFRDGDGPTMKVVPPGRLGYALAVADKAVRRSDYERFATATSRAPSRCRESQSLFARSKGLDWRNPGDAQGDDVVCVSWDDAHAFARWLSQRSGVRYRLPVRQEWPLLAQSSSGTGLWIADCANIKEVANCTEREFRGLRVRNAKDGDGAERSDTSDSDIGYANVGFRLVREIPAVSAAP